MVRLTNTLLPELVADVRASFQEASSSGECDFMVGSTGNNTGNAAGRSYPFNHAAVHGLAEITSNATGITGNAATNSQSNDPRVTPLPFPLLMWPYPPPPPPGRCNGGAAKMSKHDTFCINLFLDEGERVELLGASSSD